MNSLVAHTQRIQFIERVLGIRLDTQQICLLLEGNTPTSLESTIQLEAQIHEEFLDDLAKKLGEVPKDLAKTFSDVPGVLKFIYNVIGDKTGKNLQAGINIIRRNCITLFATVEDLVTKLPKALAARVTKVIDWVREKTKNILTIKSDVDYSDDATEDMGNWKKFLLLFLLGMMLVLLKNINAIIKRYGEKIAFKGFEKVWNVTVDLIDYIIRSPAELIKIANSAGLIQTMIPLFTVYKQIQLLQQVNSELLDSNTWLKKQ